MKKYPFSDRSNRDTLTHIVHVVKSKFPSSVCPRLHIFKSKYEKAP